MHFTRASQSGWLVAVVSASAFVCLMAAAVILSGCGEEPTFTTAQGIDIFDETLSVSQDQVECAFANIFDNSYGLAWAVVDDNMGLRIKDEIGKAPDGRDALGYYNFDDIVLLPEVAVVGLPHEMGHAIDWLTEDDPQDDHSDTRFFEADTSMEKVAGALIRERCL